MISQKICTGWSAQSYDEALLFGRRDREETKHESNGRKRRVRVKGNPKTFKVIYCGLFPRSITASCLIYRLTEIVIDLMYVLSTRPNILLRDCS